MTPVTVGSRNQRQQALCRAEVARILARGERYKNGKLLIPKTIRQPRATGDALPKESA